MKVDASALLRGSASTSDAKVLYVGMVHDDIVDVFRNSAEVLPVAEAAVQIGAKCLWFQLGVINTAASQLASDAGLSVVTNRCIKIDHAWLIRR